MAAGVLRRGGGLSEALAAAAATAAAAAPPGREQQQHHQELAGDWQGAEDGLSDVELELLLAEFAYVEQVGGVSPMCGVWVVKCEGQGDQRQV